MKKKLFLLFIFFAGHFVAHGQTEPPVITELHDLLISAKTNFHADLGAKIDADTATKTVYYETKKPSVRSAEFFIVNQPSGQNMLVITYDGKGDKAIEILPVVNQYMDELNKMVKSGDFTGDDYKNKAGMDVTDVKDKTGNMVLRYTSNREIQRIYIYGSITTK